MDRNPETGKVTRLVAPGYTPAEGFPGAHSLLRFSYDGGLTWPEVIEPPSLNGASGVTVSGFSLNNTGDTVELLQGDGTVFEVVDSVTYGDHEAEDDRSCGPDLETGQWFLFAGLNPHTGEQEPLGTGCEPTPGLPNACAPQVPVRLAAWDRVKCLYR